MEKVKLSELIKLAKNDSNIVFILCGMSGSGKTTFENELLTEIKDVFFKLPQITTRDKRPEEESQYFYVKEDVYNLLKNVLIAKIDNPNSFHGTKYGTIPVFAKNKINTVIASVDAIHELFSQEIIDKCNTKYIMMLFEIDIKDIRKEARRKDRDDDFLKKEKEDIKKVFELYKNKCLYSFEWNFSKHRWFAKLSDIIDFDIKE